LPIFNGQLLADQGHGTPTQKPIRTAGVPDNFLTTTLKNAALSGN
jgi:hypothetical protein